MKRFIKLPIFVGGEVFSTDFWLNPYQIESFGPAVLSYIDGRMEKEVSVVKVYSKSGMEYDVLLTMDQARELLDVV
jgi:hypothetical protein